MSENPSVPKIKVVITKQDKNFIQPLDSRHHQYLSVINSLPNSFQDKGVKQPISTELPNLARLSLQPIIKSEDKVDIRDNLSTCSETSLKTSSTSSITPLHKPKIINLKISPNSSSLLNNPTIGAINLNPLSSDQIESHLDHPPGCCCERHIRSQPINMTIKGESRIGANFAYSKQLSSSLMQSLPSQCKCAQFFMTSRYDCYSTKSLDPYDKAATLDYCDKHGKTFYNHINYACNFARTRLDKDKGMKAFYHIQQQIENMRGLPAACILHTGKVGKNGAHGSIENAMDNINALGLRLNTHHRMPYSLLLEVSAGQGEGWNGGRSEIGHTWEQIRWMYEALDRSTVGLCLDTQHLFASGMCNFSYEDTVRLLDTVKDYCKAGVPVIHLNDSKTNFGSRVDRHERLCFGHIWGREENRENLTYLVQRCKEDGIDLILETPEETGIYDLKLLGAIQ